MKKSFWIALTTVLMTIGGAVFAANSSTRLVVLDQMQNTTSLTKNLKMDLSGISSGNLLTLLFSSSGVATLTVPGQTDVLIGRATIDNVTNKTFLDTFGGGNKWADPVDTTKQLSIDVAGSSGSGTTLATSQTANRIVTLPDATTTLIGKTESAVVTNKTYLGFYGSRLFYADQLDNPNSADWTVNSLAPAVADGTNAGLTVRAFDDTAEECVGWTQFIPTGTASVTFLIRGRAAVAPGGTVGVTINIYTRQVPDNAAVTAWSSPDATTFSIPANTNFQYLGPATLPLASFSTPLVANRLTQFEFCRNGAAGADTLVGDFNMMTVDAQLL